MPASTNVPLSPRAILAIDEALCNGCGLCLPSCAEGALRIENGKVRIIADKLCDGLGACLGNCPRGALRIIERPAEPFDEHAVAAQTAENGASSLIPPGKPFAPATCPSTVTANASDAPVVEQTPDRKKPVMSSQGKHWPLKLQLVPLNAEFLNRAHVVLTADCAPVACSSFAARYAAEDGVVLLVCPKLESKEAIVEKLAELFRVNPPRDLILARMEVPCCCMPDLVAKAQELAGTHIPVRTSIITRFGQEKLPGFGRSGRPA